MTGNQQIDNILRGIVRILEILVPHQSRGVYLVGSYANGTALPTSDLDLIIVFKTGWLTSELKAKIFQISQQSALICPIRLDLKAYDEAQLFDIHAIPHEKSAMMRAFLHVNAVIVKTASLLIYGQDIRDRIRLPPMEAFIRDITYFTCCLIAGIRGEPQFLICPLNYPDPKDEFYGYIINDKVDVYTLGLIATSLIQVRQGKDQKRE